MQISAIPDLLNHRALLPINHYQITLLANRKTSV